MRVVLIDSSRRGLRICRTISLNWTCWNKVPFLCQTKSKFTQPYSHSYWVEMKKKLSACSLPAVCEEASVGVSGAVTTWGGTSGPLCLEGLPVEGCAIKKTLLLSAGRQRTPVGTTVCSILPTYVTQAVTARHRASAGSRGKAGNKTETRGERCSRTGRRRSVEGRQQGEK